MTLFSRPDGTLAKDVPAYRRIMPYLMRSKSVSTVYFRQVLDLEKTLPWVDAWNKAGGPRITLFHIFLHACVQVLHERPRLNRFIAGGRIHERRGIWVSYSAKKALRDDAPIVVLKKEFNPAQDFRAMVEAMQAELKVGRSDARSTVDQELGIILALPGVLIRLIMVLQEWLDAWNLLPGVFIRNDPMFASMFIANLGSIQLDAAYHHLYEYGNIPIFATLGHMHRDVVARDDGSVGTRMVAEVKYTLDERVEDGLYCAYSLERIRELVEDPEHFLGKPGA